MRVITRNGDTALIDYAKPIMNELHANIANHTFIVGMAAMLAVFGLLLWMLLNDRQVSRKEGAQQL